ncbi:hypothetical protein OH77DRAFT_1572355 [Trametes cingulata]|nr:hypothetical protein OH77DRAFT_1572355 [Trametes cingulata]
MPQPSQHSQQWITRDSSRTHASGDHPWSDIRPELIRPGKVYMVQESIRTPMELLFQHPISNLDSNSWLFQESQRSLSYLSSNQSGRSRKKRPAMTTGQVLGRHHLHDEDRRAEIYLMASFEDTPIDRIPYAYQHFVVPVAPNHALDIMPRPYYVRAYPKDWVKTGTWIIAWPFKSAHPLERLWTRKSSPNYREFDAETVTTLKGVFESRQESWRILCLDKKVAMGFAKEFRQLGDLEYLEQGFRTINRGRLEIDPRDTVNPPGSRQRFP